MCERHFVTVCHEDSLRLRSSIIIKCVRFFLYHRFQSSTSSSFSASSILFHLLYRSLGVTSCCSASWKRDVKPEVAKEKRKKREEKTTTLYSVYRSFAFWVESTCIYVGCRLNEVIMGNWLSQFGVACCLCVYAVQGLGCSAVVAKAVDTDTINVFESAVRWNIGKVNFILVAVIVDAVIVSSRSTSSTSSTQA